MTKLLAYFPSPPQGVWHLGPVPIRAYALFIIAGIVAALLIGDRRWEARGGERGVIYDIALWTVPFGLIGGRLYHLATDWRTYWGPGGAGLGAAVRIWDGGLGIWGAVALGGVGAWIGCRRHGIPLPAFADALAPGIILAQAIGRLGNYFNQELYGRETTLPWGLEVFYRRDPSGYIDPHSLDGVSTGQIAFVVQPTFLYELIWNVLIFVALIYADRRFTLGHGRLFALYVAGYCVGRFCVELLRDDTATHIAGIRINSFTSTFVFIGAVVYLMAAPKGREDPESLRGKQYLDEEAAEAEPEEEPATVAAATTAAGAGAVAAADAPTSSLETAEADETAAVDAEAEEPVADSTEAIEAEPSEAEVEEAEVEEAEVGEPEPEEPQEPEKAEAQAESDETEAEAKPEEAEESEAEEAEVEEAEVEEPEPEEPQEPERAEAEAESDETEAEAEPEETEESEAEEPEAEAAQPEAQEAEAETEEPEAEAAEPEAEESEAEELEAEQPEAEEPEAEAEEPEAEEPEAEEPEAESEEPEAEEPEAEEPQAQEPEAATEDEPAAETPEPEKPEPEKTEATTSPAQPETRRRWGSRLRNRLSGR
ncbi:prolipoprotein diacylglyceryl transferase [Mycobacterium colombiense]|uniref:Phosphatidylglycerol--prolipoprotein diacylglyceryl transferase n=1 Tax=Mycobacterium colombiense TaxID=339268 RepID=A0A853M7Q6_9MYCO|nr:prolipoprotein diacylglyceryl transferase [Mycobacterium colombiense]OBJ11315.1 prolipoprotein diacylglyceryl transferase [Mycobacterium colombiense]OBJ63058.1 prolipoprotein diacylglyceryl transferase [Mycobacterium colombiense]